MIKNILIYYYSVCPTFCRRVVNNYSIEVDGRSFWLMYINPFEYNRLSDIIFLYEMCLSFIPDFHHIVRAKSGDFFISFKGNTYVLVEFFKKHYNLDTVLVDMNKMSISLKTYMWSSLWRHKIDYLENYYNSKKITKSIDFYFDYFVGLAENAIYLFNTFFENKNCELAVQHRRYITESFYDNPLNLVVDYRVRDLAEFIKSEYLYSNLSIDEILKMVKLEKFGNSEIKLLMIRLLYPSCFFDLYEKSIREDDFVLKHSVEVKLKNYPLFLRKISQHSFFKRYFDFWISS